MNTFAGLLKYIEAIMEWLGSALKWSHADMPVDPAIETPVPTPPAPVVPPAPEAHPIDRVRLCALAQQEFEGWWPGSASFKRNNPGNIKALNGAFLTFPTYETGLSRLETYIRNVALGKNPDYPKNCTISGYTHIFTGDPEPAPTNYAAHIAAATKLSTDSPMAALLS